MKKLTIIGLLLLFVSQIALSKTLVFQKQKPPIRKRYLPDKMKVPFKLMNGLIFIKATINQKKGYFLLDTGAPNLIVNINRIKGRVHETQNYMDGINASQQIRLKFINLFQWSTYRIKYIDAMALDLSSIERVIGMPILGLIGHKIIRRFEMVLDYQKKELTLYRLNKKGDKILPYDGTLPISHTKFKMRKHLPIIAAKVNDQILKFGIDTGAQSNLLNKKLKNTLYGEFMTFEKVNLQSIGEKKEDQVAGRFTAIEVGGQLFEKMLTVLASMKLFKRLYHIQLDGLLGYEFLSSRKVSFNFKKRQMAFWKKPETNILNEVKEKPEMPVEKPISKDIVN